MWSQNPELRSVDTYILVIFFCKSITVFGGRAKEDGPGLQN